LIKWAVFWQFSGTHEITALASHCIRNKYTA